MKDVFLLYDTSCFYEIAILNYFLSCTKAEVLFCSLDGAPVRATEGYSVNVDLPLEKVSLSEIRSFIVPGGDISHIKNQEVKSLLQALKKQKVLIGGICAGVELLEAAGILSDIKSTRSTNEDMVRDHGVITARANAYVDFAVEIAKALELFVDEDDLQETIDFWKYHKRVE